MSTPLSPHFTLEELTFTSHHSLDNTPSVEQVANLRALANEHLEQCREIVGPMHVDSAFRSAEVNAAVGGAKTSQHMDGNACDWIPMNGMSLKEAYEKIQNSNVKYDQLIFEFGRWVHVSRAPSTRAPRRMCLMIGSWTGGRYMKYDAKLIPGT